jgi:hypothetical protein
VTVGLFQREDVAVDVQRDVVVFKVGPHTARFAYETAFVVAQRLRLSANVAARTAGVAKGERADLKRQRVDPDQFAESHAIEGGRLDFGFQWNVWTEGELVAFQFGNEIARWDAPSAMTIATWFREGGRQAKAWAGDTSRRLNIAGVLSDASRNNSTVS